MVNNSTTQLDATFAALADPTRRRLLEKLSRGESRVTDLAEPFDMSLPAVSKHLRVLENAGLLERRRSGREFHLELNAEPMQEALRWIGHYRRFWEGSLDALAEFLETTHPINPNTTQDHEHNDDSTRPPASAPADQGTTRKSIRSVDKTRTDQAMAGPEPLPDYLL